MAAALVDEQVALDELVGGLTEDRWALPTPSAGWSIADSLGHLAHFDGAAASAITDTAEFGGSLGTPLRQGGDLESITLHRDLGPDELLATWCRGREVLTAAAASLEDGTRVPWYGPSMGARSFLTAG